MSRARIVLAALLVALVVAGIAVATSQKHFRVIAAGEFEVPIRDSPALGRANFYVGQGGETLGYRLSVTKIENVTQAHIHLAPPGANGDIVVWLYPSTAPPAAAPGGGPVSGTIAQGVITAANLTGPLAGMKISDLIEELQSGNAYVNVHTNDGVDPANTGPGDFPGGEIRGNF
jgi:CHRD domain